jgi:hypothetical protein
MVAILETRAEAIGTGVDPRYVKLPSAQWLHRWVPLASPVLFVDSPTPARHATAAETRLHVPSIRLPAWPEKSAVRTWRGRHWQSQSHQASGTRARLESAEHRAYIPNHALRQLRQRDRSGGTNVRYLERVPRHSQAFATRSIVGPPLAMPRLRKISQIGISHVCLDLRGILSRSRTRRHRQTTHAILGEPLPNPMPLLACPAVLSLNYAKRRSLKLTKISLKNSKMASRNS